MTSTTKTVERDWRALWEDAVKEYERTTGRSIGKNDLDGHLSGLKLSHGQSFEELTESIAIDENKFEAHRKEKQRVISKFRRCIAPTKLILDIAEKGIDSTPAAPLNILFVAVNRLLGACEEVSRSYDAVEELFDRIESATRGLETYQERSLQEPLRPVLVKVLACMLKVVGLAESKILKASRLRQFGRQLFQDDDQIQRGISELKKRVKDELGIVIRLSYRKTQQLSETADKTLEEVLEIKQHKTNILSADSRQAIPNNVGKLKNESYDEVQTYHRKNVDAITKQTGTWIQNDSMFDTWKNGEGPVLWIFGRPGVGKTVLAAATVETLKNRFSRDANASSVRPVGYIYFKENQPGLQNLRNMLLTVALQYAKQDSKFDTHLHDVIAAYPDTLGNATSAKSIWNRLFLSYESGPDDFEKTPDLFYLIVDGLDEANEEDKQAFLSCLNRLLTSQPDQQRSIIQVAVFARPEIRRLLDKGDKIFEGSERRIDITEDKTKEDIRAYVKYNIKDVDAVKELKKVNPKVCARLERDIEERIVSRAQGMFLWAKLAFDQIRDVPSPEAVREALEDAPLGLMDMIHMVFLRLNSEKQVRIQYLNSLFAWVLCSNRPLLMAELYVCLYQATGDHFSTIEKDLSTRYSSLFDVIELSIKDEASNTLRTGSVSSPSIMPSKDTASETDTDFDQSDDDGEEVSYAATSPSLESFRRTSSALRHSKDLPKHWYRTTVTFSHAKIRDYLKQEGNPSTRKWSDSQVVPSNLNTFKVRMVGVLLDLVTTPLAQRFDLTALKQYAADNCVTPLLEVDLKMIPHDLCSQTGAKLARCFFDGDRMYDDNAGRWHFFTDTWVLSNRKSSVVCQLIHQGIPSLQGEIRSWAVRASGSAKDLLSPTMAACFRRWLTKKGWDDVSHFYKCESETWLLLAYEFLTPEGQNSGPLDVLAGRRGMGQMPLDLIEQVAKSQHLSEDEYWHVGVAWTIMAGKNSTYTHKAIEYFEKAISLAEIGEKNLGRAVGPTAWVAYEGLGRCYGDNFRQPQLAIDFMQKAIEALPQVFLDVGVDLYFKARIAKWQLQIGCSFDQFDAMPITENGYKRSHEYVYGANIVSDALIMDSVLQYIEVLSLKKAYGRIGEVIRDLAARQTLHPGCSLLNCLLRYRLSDWEFRRLMSIISMTAYQVQDDGFLGFLKETFKSIAYVDKNGIYTWFDLRLAARSSEFLERHCKDWTDAASIYKSILHVVDQGNVAYQQRMAPLRTQAASFVSFCHFTEAVSARVSGSKIPRASVSKLKAFAMEGRKSKEDFCAAYPALLYGIWLRDHQNNSPDRWRRCFKPSITHALHLLADDDPWNDHNAFVQLGEALMMANDLENASIALGLTMKPLDDIQHPPSAYDRPVMGGLDPNRQRSASIAKPINPEYTGFGFEHRCDGVCDPNKEDYAELWCCQICEKVYFCGDCYPLIKNQNTETDRYVVCSPSHPHVRAYPLSPEARTMVSALENGDLDVYHRWLERLKTEWAG